MSEQNEYSKLTLEELLVEEKQVKQVRMIFIALAVGTTAFTLYAIAVKKHTGFGHVASILFSLFLLMRNGTTLKRIQAEIKERAAS